MTCLYAWFHSVKQLGARKNAELCCEFTFERVETQAVIDVFAEPKMQKLVAHRQRQRNSVVRQPVAKEDFAFGEIAVAVSLRQRAPPSRPSPGKRIARPETIPDRANEQIGVGFSVPSDRSARPSHTISLP